MFECLDDRPVSTTALTAMVHSMYGAHSRQSPYYPPRSRGVLLSDRLGYPCLEQARSRASRKSLHTAMLSRKGYNSTLYKLPWPTQTTQRALYQFPGPYCCCQSILFGRSLLLSESCMLLTRETPTPQLAVPKMEGAGRERKRGGGG